jgi:hypothetical protein
MAVLLSFSCCEIFLVRTLCQVALQFSFALPFPSRWQAARTPKLFIFRWQLIQLGHFAASIDA